MIRKKTKRRGFDRSKFKDGLRKRMKTGQQKMQGFEPTHLKIPEGVNFWNPKAGEHTIDILPYIAGDNDPMTDKGEPTYTCQYLVHKDVGPQKKWYVCPEQYEKECPICEERRALQDEGLDKESWKHLYPRERNLYNIVVYDSREEEKKGVQVLDVATFYMEENLLKIAVRSKAKMRRSERSKKKTVEPFIDFSSPDKDGKIITFDIEAAKSRDSYQQWGGHAFEDRDYEIDDELLSATHILDSFLIVPSYDDLKEVFSKGKDDEGEEESEDEEEIEIDEEDTADEDEDEEEDDGEEEDDDELTCEFGYEFGIDANDYDECESECDEKCWRACVAEKEKKNKKKKRIIRKKRR